MILRTAYLPLHYGSAPRWLFNRMVQLSGAISEVIVLEYGKKEFLQRLSDPFFFQSFACAVGFDYHSSGCTTTLTGALKAALNNKNLGIFVAGGKGKTSRKTPLEIESIGLTMNLSEKAISDLKYVSRISAKVDNDLVQDSYKLYHHAFIFSEDRKYVVIQQGMNTATRYARRYHWLSDTVVDFVDEPHTAICCNRSEESVLNITAKTSKDTRAVSLDLVNDGPQHLQKYLGQTTLTDFKDLHMPKKHSLTETDLSPKVLEQLRHAYDIQPGNYEELVSLRGIGAKTIRSLALISELIYGTEPSWQDPRKFAFALGGKDGFPYPIDREQYDETITILSSAIEDAKIKNKERLNAIRRLYQLWRPPFLGIR